MTLTKRSTVTWPDVRARLFGPIDLEANAIKVEEFREDGTTVVRAELPGIDPEKDVEITVRDGWLHLHAERREEHAGEEDGTYHSEFRYGSFDRSLRLPAGSTEDNVTATYHDGILEVRLPVDDNAVSAKRIPVTKA